MPQGIGTAAPELDAARRVELAATIKTETKWLDDKKAARKGRGGGRPTKKDGDEAQGHKDALFNAQQELAGNRARAVAQRRATNADVRAHPCFEPALLPATCGGSYCEDWHPHNCLK